LSVLTKPVPRRDGVRPAILKASLLLAIATRLVGTTQVRLVARRCIVDQRHLSLPDSRTSTRNLLVASASCRCGGPRARRPCHGSTCRWDGPWARRPCHARLADVTDHGRDARATRDLPM